MADKDGRAVRLSKEAIEYLEEIRQTKLGAVAIGNAASAIILMHKRRSRN